MNQQEKYLSGHTPHRQIIPSYYGDGPGMVLAITKLLYRYPDNHILLDISGIATAMIAQIVIGKS